MNDTDMYERLLVVGKRMLVTSVELDELVNSEAESAEASDGELRGTQHSNHYKYWIAFASRADILADKVSFCFLFVDLEGLLMGRERREEVVQHSFSFPSSLLSSFDCYFLHRKQ